MLCGSVYARDVSQTFPSTCTSPLECATQSVVSLLPDWPAGFSRAEEPEGSGIVISDGKLIATADHVLGPAKTARIRTVNGELMDAKIVMRDPLTDIAFMEINHPLPAFSFAEQYNLADQACAIGNSFGLDISITCGVVSARQVSGVGFNKIEDFIQTDASVNPGMSGGALVDENGKLIGLLSAIFTRQSDANIGVNFAVSVALLQRVLDDFEEDGVLAHRKSGLVVRPSKPTQEKERLLSFIGAEVIRVEAGSPEEKAGINAGDVVLYAGDKRIKRAGAYVAAISLLSEGENLELTILRDGKIMQKNVNYE